jgi:hydrogenase maturation protease
MMPNKHIVVLGLGNLLNSDEGVGVHAVRVMQNEWSARFPHVEFVDGGTLGLNLLPWVENATHLLLLDSINAKQPPATLIEMTREEIPLFAQVKMSIHQLTFQEVLGIAKMRGKLPAHVHLIGVQPASLEISTALSAAVQARVPEILRRAQDLLEQWVGSAN